MIHLTTLTEYNMTLVPNSSLILSECPPEMPHSIWRQAIKEVYQLSIQYATPGGCFHYELIEPIVSLMDMDNSQPEISRLLHFQVPKRHPGLQRARQIYDEWKHMIELIAESKLNHSERELYFEQRNTRRRR